MARITIEIDTHDADAADERILAAVSGGHAVSFTLTQSRENPEAVYVDTPTEAERSAAGGFNVPGSAEAAAEAPKRTRRTKAQIEADNAAQATAGASSAASDTSGPTATETAPQAETAPTLDTTTDEGAMTLQMVEDRIKHLMSQGVPAISLVGICKDQAGVSSARHADPSKLPAIWAALGELMS